ncbi:VOC family protein [Nocardia brasiliensis]|uniref:VOC family protein n=1 Tax=Nocardia brasiliensis TaxID=37326 RepID=UPI002454A4BF|nr:VOC family protein [Nocardia brasiliensis]
MYGMPSWFDVTTAEPVAAIGFYTQLFEWTAAPVLDTEYGKYIMFRKAGLPVAGLVERRPGTVQPDGWLTYLSTEELAPAIAVARDHGGSVQRPAVEIPGVGATAVLTDPVDSSIGLVRSAAGTEFAPAGPGTPVWTEIETVNWPVTFDFVTGVFRVRTENQSTTPGSRFATIHDAEHPRGGIFELPGDVPHSRWEVAFLVPDAQQAVDRAVGLGASIVRPVYDVPVGAGVGARLADPTGSHFNVIAF